jgi:phosphoribosyl 1,2-cyclic phosphate phosphodiesterase
MVEVDGKTLVIDTGPDFRQQMLRHRVDQVDAVLLTHKHKDHIAGLDDVRAYNFTQGVPMPVYADELTIGQLKNEFPYVFDGSNYPGIPRVEVHPLKGSEPFEAVGVAVQPLPVMHYMMPVTCFRIGDMAYITDASYIDDSTFDLLHGVKVLVLNALRIEKHISHFNLEQALKAAARIGAEQTYFTHLSHLMGTHTEAQARLPEGVFIAYDGQVVDC